MTKSQRLRLMLAVLSILAFTACGVKLPPIAPEHAPGPPQAPNLDCSPSDETCDKTDPNYQPRKR